MPKMKTKRAAAKRFKMTAGGKIRRQKAMRRHKLTKKSRGRKRGLRAAGLVSPSDLLRVRRMLGFG